MYSVFVRNWWINNPEWPRGLEPCGSCPKRYLATDIATEAEARAMAQKYNKTHKPGRYSRKAEFEVTTRGRGNGKRRSA